MFSPKGERESLKLEHLLHCWFSSDCPRGVKRGEQDSKSLRIEEDSPKGRFVMFFLTRLWGCSRRPNSVLPNNTLYLLPDSLSLFF